MRKTVMQRKSQFSLSDDKIQIINLMHHRITSRRNKQKRMNPVKVHSKLLLIKFISMHLDSLQLAISALLILRRTNVLRSIEEN